MLAQYGWGLPDASKVINVIQRDNPKFMAAIDLSDMVFPIPIQEASRPITTFTWQGKQYQCKRLPQGYKNSPTIAHTILTSQIDPTQYSSKIITHIDDILLYHDDGPALAGDLNRLIQYL